MIVSTELLAFPDASHTHTGAHAHTGNANALVLTFEFREKGGNLASTSAAKESMNTSIYCYIKSISTYPRGWPMAIAPPLGLTFSLGIPRTLTV